MLFFLFLPIIYFFELFNGISTRECGKSKNRLSNSTGVQVSFVGETPWHVGIYKYKGDKFENVCCGSIISTHIIITAANCVYDVSKTPWILKVIAGKIAYKWNDVDHNAQEMNVMSIHIPEQYIGYTESYSQNLALLGLSNYLEFNEFVSPVCIDWGDTGVKWRNVGASGWGFKSGNDYNLILKYVNLPYLNVRQCQRQYSSVTIIHDKFCIVTNEGRQNRDSGSGIIFQNKDVNYIHGVLSANIADEFSVATNISKYTNWLRETIAKIDSEDRCDNGFRCHGNKCIEDGNNCLEDIYRCDGCNDCQDKSDESVMECGYSAGSCAASYRRGCILPKQKGGGSYTRVDCQRDQCELKPYSVVRDNEEIILNCGPGYAPKNENLTKYICKPGGTWFHEDPLCIKMCRPIEKHIVLTTCEYECRKVDCKDYTRPGTKLEYKCKKFYKIKDSLAYKGYTECLDSGQWGETLPTCVPDCGTVNKQNEIKPTISGGKKAVYGKYPWHVGIFKQYSNNRFVNICGGSIIHPHMVLTAAHCLYEETTGKRVNISRLAVAGGKYKRDWYEHEETQQSSYVRDVIIPEGYEGRTSLFQYDIAIINLSGTFSLNDFVLPVCIDWENRGIFPHNAEGTIVGWGQTDKNFFSENLIEIHLPYLTKMECWDKFKDYAQYITIDKFCVVSKDGAGAEHGDSGGGMTFPMDKKHFIHGIVSTKQASTTTIISNPFRAMTNVTSYLSWISSTISKYNRV